MMADAASTEGVGLPEPATLDVGAGEEAVSRETETSAVAAEGTTEGATEESGGEEGQSAVPGAEQAKSIFQQLREADEATSAVAPEELPPEVKPGSRAAETITGLRARAQRAESEHANLQQVVSQNQRQFQQWAGQLQQQNQQMREEMIRLQTQMQYAPQAPVQPKSEAQQYLDQLSNQFGQQLVDPKIQALQQRLDAQDQWIAQQNQQAEVAKQTAWRDQQAETLKTEAAQLWRSNVLREVPPDVQTPEANLGQFLILAALASNPHLNMQQCAKMVRDTILGSAHLIERHARTSIQKSLETGKQAVAAMPRSASDGATKEGNPDMDLLLYNGFNTPMDWKDAGKPRLKPMPKAA